jgi:toxin ParE1/3/4
MQVSYTWEAEDDLINIGVYTRMEWGDEQWEFYGGRLTDACEQTIPANAHRARPVPGSPDLRRWRCERHVIYFRFVDAGLEIVRVLHESMLPELHL